MIRLFSVFVGLLFVVFNDKLVDGLLLKPKSKTSDQIRTNEPVIGVLTQETTGKIRKFGQGQYLLTSYVKMIEALGGRVVPFLINQTPQQVENMFYAINGVVFPGGHVKLQHSKYGAVGKQIFELAKQANDKGSVFPIWAECLGLELIALLASERGLSKGQYDTGLFNYTFAKNHTAPLTFSNEYKNSHLFGRLPPDMVKFMTTKLRSWHNHNKAIIPAKFKSHKALANMFRVLSTNKDKKGREFISTMEGKKYPFFLLHWHPTKAQTASLNNPDSNQEAVSNAQYLVNVFLNLARRSDHRFQDEYKKNAALISRYPVTSNDQVDAYFIKM